VTPFDLDAVAAEADGEPFVFTFGGEEYVLAPKVDIRVGIALAEEDWIGALRRMLGDQWDRLVASPAALTGPLAGTLIRAYLDHSGQSAGESSASSRSSGNTARPSKRTSRATTTLR
jgi:hypothetical protein